MGVRGEFFDKQICQPKTVKDIQTSNTYLLICQTFLTFLDSSFAVKGADFSGEGVEVVEAAVVAVGGSA